MAQSSARANLTLSSPLVVVLSALGCSADTARILTSEEFDATVLVESSFGDFKQVGISDADARTILNWVQEVKLETMK
jgi:rhodanese-related sulfurtransferase